MAQVIRSGQRAGSSTVTQEREDGTVVIEADAAEDAVALARERFGADVEIIEVNRLERGGVKGFFAREYFNVIAGPPTPRPSGSPGVTPPGGARPEVDALVRQIGQVGVTPVPAPQPAPAPAPEAGRDEPTGGIGRALGKVETEEEAFGSMLRRELHARGLTPSAADTIDLTDGRGSGGSNGPSGERMRSVDGVGVEHRGGETGAESRGPVGPPVPVGPATARPLRPKSSSGAVPPPPVPPMERFRLDEPSGATVTAPRTARSVAPLPVRAEAPTDAARAALQDAVVVDSQALVRPQRGTAPPTPPPAARPVETEPVTVESAPDPVEPAHRAEPARPAQPAEGAESAEAMAVVDSGPSIESDAPAVEPEVSSAADTVAISQRVPSEPGNSSTVVAVRTAVPETPPGLGSVRWSVDRLAHLGLPFALVQRTVGLDPTDDQRWLLTLAAGLADFVRPEPAGSAVFAGPRADRVGAAMDLPVVEAPELPPYGGPVALKTTDDGAGRAWLSRVRGDRVLHVVVGGRGWELLLAKDPDAVVISSADSVLTGLQVAVEHRVPISYVSDADGLRRADALDLAIAVRSLVGRW